MHTPLQTSPVKGTNARTRFYRWLFHDNPPGPVVPDWRAYSIRPYPDGPKKQDHFLNPYVFGVTLTAEKNEPRGCRGSKNMAVRIMASKCEFKKWDCRGEGGDHFLSRLKT